MSPVAAPSRPSPARSGGRLKPSSGPGRTKASAAALAALIAAVAALAAAPAQAQTPEPQASLPDLEDEVMCIVCGVPLGQAPDAPQAERERAFIRELIAEGRTKDEIKDALVVEFGENVLATPDTEGFDLAAWLVPGLGDPRRRPRDRIRRPALAAGDASRRPGPGRLGGVAGGPARVRAPRRRSGALRPLGTRTRGALVRKSRTKAPFLARSAPRRWRQSRAHWSSLFP